MVLPLLRFAPQKCSPFTLSIVCFFIVSCLPAFKNTLPSDRCSKSLTFGVRDIDVTFERDFIQMPSGNLVHRGPVNEEKILLTTPMKNNLVLTGKIKVPNALNKEMLLHFRRRLLFLEGELSKLSLDDLRWCSRYCKNLFYFSAGTRNFATTITSILAEEFGWEGDVRILNDELSYNLPGENHDHNWHLDGWAWKIIPSDAWAMTIYIPLDTAYDSDGGGWLRFRSKADATETDEYFGPGDLLIFDRWIWHKLVEFTSRNSPRVAYLIRVSNATWETVKDLRQGLPATHMPRFVYDNVTSGCHINYICEDYASCSLPVQKLGGKEYKHPTFKLDVQEFIRSAANLSYTRSTHSKISLEAKKISEYMCAHPTM